MRTEAKERVKERVKKVALRNTPTSGNKTNLFYIFLVETLVETRLEQDRRMPFSHTTCTLCGRWQIVLHQQQHNNTADNNLSHLMAQLFVRTRN